MILDAFKLNGKVALVTGDNGGLGQGMAITSRSGEARNTLAAIEQTGRRAYLYLLTDSASLSP